MLYLVEGGPEQCNLGEHLCFLEIDLRYESSVTIAEQRLREQRYSLLMICFEHFQDRIFEFCIKVRDQIGDAHILILMEEADPQVEKTLFEYGVDDVVAGK